MKHETESNENISGKLRRLPSYEEVDEMVAKAFPGGGGMCRTLCHEYQAAADALEDAAPQFRARLIARMRALATQMKALHCPTCLFE